MKRNDRSGINPFTGKKHFDIVNDDKFLNKSYGEYNNIINQSEILDETSNGQIVSNVSLKLIEAVENHLLEINRTDYTKNYYDWEFHLVSNDTVNAFCMPGGKILVYSGILSVANNEEFLAFILGHEMAHALLDHGRTQVSAYKAKNSATTAARLGSIGLGLMGLGEIGSAVQTVTNLADVGSEYLLMKPWGRDQEMEADELGMKIIRWAGYDISEIPNFWQRMSQINSNKYDFFSTHPSDSKRINAMNKLVLELPSQETVKDTKIVRTSNNFCSKCGNVLKKEDNFCSKCGNKISIQNVVIENLENNVMIYGYTERYLINSPISVFINGEKKGEIGRKGILKLKLENDSEILFKCGFRKIKQFIRADKVNKIQLSFDRMTGKLLITDYKKI